MEQRGLLVLLILFLTINHIFGKDVLRIVLAWSIIFLFVLRWICRILALTFTLIAAYYHELETSDLRSTPD